MLQKKNLKKAKFIRQIDNSKYLKDAKYDILILHTNASEFGKSVIEAMSLKKPIILNRPKFQTGN